MNGDGRIEEEYWYLSKVTNQSPQTACFISYLVDVSQDAEECVGAGKPDYFVPNSVAIAMDRSVAIWKWYSVEYLTVGLYSAPVCKLCKSNFFINTIFLSSDGHFIALIALSMF